MTHLFDTNCSICREKVTRKREDREAYERFEARVIFPFLYYFSSKYIYPLAKGDRPEKDETYVPEFGECIQIGQGEQHAQP